MGRLALPGPQRARQAASRRTQAYPRRSTTPGSAGAGGTGGNGAAGSTAPAGNPNAFSTIYSEIMAQRCAGTVCHSGTTGGGLSLQSGSASAIRSSLLNRAASGSECTTSGMQLVVPGNPDMSLLYRKLSDTPPCGARMPPTAALTAEQIGRIRAWIANGALDD